MRTHPRVSLLDQRHAYRMLFELPI
eukprot:SAG31_NODE_24577_length_478_cov_1.350923_2_plen_24_part_01